MFDKGIVDVRNERIFPTFAACPHDDELNQDDPLSPDYQLGYGPSRNWCLLAEITGVNAFLRLRIELKDRAGDEFFLAFYLDNDAEQPNPADYTKGHTMVLIGAAKHAFMDGSVGIREDEDPEVAVRLL